MIKDTYNSEIEKNNNSTAEQIHEMIKRFEQQGICLAEKQASAKLDCRFISVYIDFQNFEMQRAATVEKAETSQPRQPPKAT